MSNDSENVAMPGLIARLVLPSAGVAEVLKRAEDIVLASVAVVLFAPLMAGVALAIRLDSPGPALFRQARHGRDGRIIRVCKFRTMRVDTGTGVAFRQTERDDPRVTRLGALLRRTSLDELPQLFNVLEGSMSMVGPRPHPVELDARFERLVPDLGARYAVKPGITGWAQINGYRGATHRLEDMLGRVEHDRLYIRHWSLAFDLEILVRTLLGGWTHDNAY